MSGFKLRHAVHALNQGDVIAYPTEAVYGLGCDPDDEEALIDIILMKRRPLDKGLILIASDFNQLQPYIETLPAEALARVHQSWPGPYTWVVPARSSLSPIITGGRDSVAVRVTAHPIARAICEQFGGAIVSTSANLTGLTPARTAYQTRWQFPSLKTVVPGACDKRAQPSQIQDALTGVKFR